MSAFDDALNAGADLPVATAGVSALMGGPMSMFGGQALGALASAAAGGPSSVQSTSDNRQTVTGTNHVGSGEWIVNLSGKQSVDYKKDQSAEASNKDDKPGILGGGSGKINVMQISLLVGGLFVFVLLVKKFKK